jgi:hypothetical protein
MSFGEKGSKPGKVKSAIEHLCFAGPTGTTTRGKVRPRGVVPVFDG